MFNILIEVHLANRSILEAIESGDKNRIEREAMQQEYNALRNRLDSVRELFR